MTGDDDRSWAERVADAAAAPPDERRGELRRVAGATRALIDRLVAIDAPPDVLSRTADHVEAAVRALADYPQGRLYEGFAEAANAGDHRAFFDHSPIIGAANPLAPPLVLEAGEGAVHGTVRFGAAYEGPPGHVHGGYLAAVFDEVLGMAQSLSGNPGMTGRLVVKYRNPTPLHTDLRFEGRLERVEGRKLFTVGTCHAGDVLTAEAEGLFISVDFARMYQLMAERDAERRSAQD